MTTAREIKELVRPILERNAGLALVNRNFIWFCPTGQVGRLVLIDRTSRATCFAVRWHLTEFFMPDVKAWNDLGRCKDWIFRSKGFYGGSGWYWTDPTIKDDFITRVEADAVAVLRPLDTTRKCLEFARTHAPSNGYLGPHWHLIAAIALGELDEAREMWTRMGRYYRQGIPTEWDNATTFHRYRMLDGPLMAGDRTELAAILNGWAAEKVKGSPLEPHWEPGPLPIEEMI
jgi:hypothetical protein